MQIAQAESQVDNAPRISEAAAGTRSSNTAVLTLSPEKLSRAGAGNGTVTPPTAFTIERKPQKYVSRAEPKTAR